MTLGNKTSAFWATGLMLFALFFGAGNLIFPALIGQQAGTEVLPAMLGFLLTGVGLPVLGVVAMAYSGSRDVNEMGSRVAPWYGVLFGVMLYLAIGPLFATPRTATVSFEIGIVPFLGDVPEDGRHWYLFGFCVCFFLISWWLSLSPGKLVDRIGKVLTPALLLTIALLVLTAVFRPMGPPQAPVAAYAANPVIRGALAGYETMDVLASLAFGIIVIDAIRGFGVTGRRQMIGMTLLAGLVAGACLAFVYVSIAWMGATSVAGLGLQENGAIVLARSAEHYFGGTGRVLLAVIVLLACLSTAVGLIIACSEYFERLLPRVPYRVWVSVFTLVSFGFANVGLSTIIRLSIPALMLLYPLTMALVALAFLHRLFGGRRIVYACTMAGTALVALFDGWKAFSGVEDGVARQVHLFLEQHLPLYPAGLGWVLPSVAGFCIGLLLSTALPERTRALGA